MSGQRPYAWEGSYPPGVVWDAPIGSGTVLDLLDGAIARFEDRPFVEFHGHRLTYRGLGEHVDRAAAGLQALGVGLGVAVALYLPNTPYHLISFFGALRAGGRVVHLSPLDPLRSLAHKLSDSGARVLITTDLAFLLPHALSLLDQGHLDRLVVGEHQAWSDGVAAATSPVPGDRRITSFADLGGARTPEWPDVTPGDIALLQYTGGTTGVPRAAVLTHGNMFAVNRINEHWYHGVWQPGDRVLGVLPLFHIYMLSVVMLRALTAGAEIMLRSRFDASKTLDDIEKGGANVLPAVPTMIIAMAAQPDLGRRDLKSLRNILCGGAPLPVEVAQRFETLTGIRIGGGWGMTELAPAGTDIPQGMAMRPGLIGVPLPGIRMDIADLADPSRSLQAGERGEIRIRGPNVMAGYWNKPDETRDAFVDGWFLTGDVGFMDEAGRFYIVDRKKEMIISGGFNVYPRVIEDAIYEHPSVEECSVIGIEDAYRGQAGKAFIKLRQGNSPFTIEALRSFLGDKLGRHELPAALEFRDALPRTGVGKLSRKELANEEDARHPSGDGVKLPGGQTSAQ